MSIPLEFHPVFQIMPINGQPGAIQVLETEAEPSASAIATVSRRLWKLHAAMMEKLREITVPQVGRYYAPGGHIQAWPGDSYLMLSEAREWQSTTDRPIRRMSDFVRLYPDAGVFQRGVRSEAEADRIAAQMLDDMTFYAS